MMVCDRPATKSDKIVNCGRLLGHKFRKFRHNLCSVFVQLSFRHKQKYSITNSVTNCDGLQTHHNFPSQKNSLFVVNFQLNYPKFIVLTYSFAFLDTQR